MGIPGYVLQRVLELGEGELANLYNAQSLATAAAQPFSQRKESPANN